MGLVLSSSKFWLLRSLRPGPHPPPAAPLSARFHWPKTLFFHWFFIVFCTFFDFFSILVLSWIIMASKTPPRRLQDGPRRLQDGPRGCQAAILRVLLSKNETKLASKLDQKPISTSKGDFTKIVLPLQRGLDFCKNLGWKLEANIDDKSIKKTLPR